VTAESERLGTAEDAVQVGPEIRLVRFPGECYVALISGEGDVRRHQLDLGLGRLVWTVATAAPTTDCERARRVLAEAGIV